VNGAQRNHPRPRRKTACKTELFSGSDIGPKRGSVSRLMMVPRRCLPTQTVVGSPRVRGQRALEPDPLSSPSAASEKAAEGLVGAHRDALRGGVRANIPAQKPVFGGAKVGSVGAPSGALTVPLGARWCSPRRASEATSSIGMSSRLGFRVDGARIGSALTRVPRGALMVSAHLGLGPAPLT
jgi:hypothetical protein